MKILRTDVAHHRNGVAGEGFHVVKFRMKDSGEPIRDMVAVVFDGRGQVAVLDVALLAHGVIAFTENSWRGDDFEPTLRDEIRRWETIRAAEVPA